MQTQSFDPVLPECEILLYQSFRKPRRGYVFYCFMLSAAFLLCAFAHEHAEMNLALIALGVVMAIWGARVKGVERESVCVTSKRLVYNKAGLWGSSSDTAVMVPIEDIAGIRCLKDSVMFGERTSGAVMLKLVDGKILLLPTLIEGECIAECAGKLVERATQSKFIFEKMI